MFMLYPLMVYVMFMLIFLCYIMVLLCYGLVMLYVAMTEMLLSCFMLAICYVNVCRVSAHVHTCGCVL